MHPYRPGSALALLSVLVTALLVSSSAPAATVLVVDSAADDGAGTLRAAIAAANADASPDPVQITFAIGTGAQSIAPVTALPAITRPVVIDGTTQPGFAGVPLVELRGDGVPAGASGLVLSGHDGSVVRGLVVNRFAPNGSSGGYGIEIASGSDDHVVAGNYLGTDAAGTASAGTQRGGVSVRGSNVRIGGDVAADRNVLAGNTDYGIVWNAGTALVVRGNYVGVGADGTTRVANGNGIFCLNAATNGLWEDNVLAGNTSTQVTIGNFASSGHVVRKNRIGVRADGTAVVAGGSTGINVNGAPGATLEDNLIGGLSDAAIAIRNAGSNGITVRGNRIGVDATGTIALPVVRGIVVSFSASGSPMDVTIGGIGSGDGNVVTNATAQGVVVLGGLSGNVGQITRPAGVRIRGNAIFANAGPAIDLEDDGPSANDPAPDDDLGANGLQNTPVLTAADHTGGVTTVAGTLDSAASTTFDVDFYASNAADPSGFGEGATYLGTVAATTDVAGHATFQVPLPPVAPGHVVTATATSPSGDTSEFSNAVAVTGDPLPVTTTTSTSTTSTSTIATTSTSTPTTTSSSTSTSSTTAPPATSTTTTLAAGSTTTTTPPACPDTGIPQVLCLLDALPPSACDGVVLPKPALRGLAAVRAQLEKAMGAPPKRSRRLLRKAATRMRRVSAGVGKAAAKDKVPGACATDLRTALDAARALTQGIVVAP